jgi:uncharacterized protein YbaP (TraB family)
MPGWAARLFSRERNLRMVWEIARHGRSSRLVGTAHFFPYHFRSALQQLIEGARTVLLEGPLDDTSLRKVVDAGSGAVHASLYHALDARARQRVCRLLGLPDLPLDAPQLYRQVLFGPPHEWLESDLRGLKPWMAFFGLWTRFRTRLGGSYSLDLDAARTAARLGRAVQHLESIDEQIATLDAIPLERIVAFVADVDWEAYYEDYVRRYLEGDLDGLIAAARVFPTYCEPVIERRDPLLAERMTPALEAGDACAFVGITHIPGVSARLRARGYEVTPLRAGRPTSPRAASR